MTRRRRSRHTSALGRRARTSRRTRKSLALVFALIFAPVAARHAHAACLEFTIPAAISLATNGAISVIAADIDGDGDFDAVGSATYGNGFWFENNGAGGGWTAHTISTSTDHERAATATDVDGDGDLDLVAASLPSSQIVWYANNGNGTSWIRRTVSLGTGDFRSLSAGDVDGDGDLDVLSAAFSFSGTAIAWFENDDPTLGSTWNLRTIATLTYGAMSVFAADVDGDGQLDALSASILDNKIAWYRNDGTPLDGGWVEATISTAALSAYAVSAADLDGDGDLDALAASSAGPEIAWFENGGTGTETWTLTTISLAATAPRWVAVADMDGDGDLDALTASMGDNGIAWYENHAQGTTWTPHTLSTSALGAYAVTTADVDGDGDADVLSASHDDDKIAWYRNDRLHDKALFNPFATISSAADEVYSVALADVDGDGDLDALSASLYDNKIAWYENSSPSGDGSSWAMQEISSAVAGAFSVAAADVDGDGHVDALSAARFGQTVAWHRNLPPFDGSSWTLMVISASTVNPLPWSVAAADLDGDGDLDAITANVGASLVNWYENRPPGDGSIWSEHGIAGLIGAYFVHPADVDGDGDADVLAVGYQDNVRWYENGVGSLWTPVDISNVPDMPWSIDTADVDGDGDLDALTASRYDNRVAWHENAAVSGDGSSWVLRAIGTTAQEALRVVSGDIDGDGDVDAFVAAHDVVWFENLPPGNGSVWTIHTLSTQAGTTFTAAVGDIDGDGHLDGLSGAIGGDTIAWFRNLGTGVFDDGFDSDGNKACWSSSVPP